MHHRAIVASMLTVPCAVSVPFAPAGVTPSVPGALPAGYASPVNPAVLDVGPDGVVYAGQEDNGDFVSVWKIPGPGGFDPFGDPRCDPDSVVLDVDGVVGGVPGALLVGGSCGVRNPDSGRCEFDPDNNGCITLIAPDGTTIDLYGPDPDIGNVTWMRIDARGRLLFTRTGSGRIFAIDGAVVGAVVTPSGYAIAYFDLDADGNIRAFCNDGRIRVFDLDGGLIATNPATGLGTQAVIASYAGGPRWAAGDYIINSNTFELSRVDPDGTTTLLGTGFPGCRGIRFGPDGALYAGAQVLNRVYRVIPCPANLVADTTLDLADITAFASGFLAQEPAVDFAEPFGLFDLSDITAFVTMFIDACE
jgi:sugar lactone lactonase YvrE